MRDLLRDSLRAEQLVGSLGAAHLGMTRITFVSSLSRKGNIIQNDVSFSLSHNTSRVCHPEERSDEGPFAHSRDFESDSMRGSMRDSLRDFSSDSMRDFSRAEQFVGSLGAAHLGMTLFMQSVCRRNASTIRDGARISLFKTSRRGVIPRPCEGPEQRFRAFFHSKSACS